MPSGDFSRPTGPKVPVKKRPPVRKTAPPVTDVQSTSGYTIPKRPPAAPNPWSATPANTFPTGLSKPEPTRKPLLPSRTSLGKKAEWAKSPSQLQREISRRQTQRQNKQAVQAGQWDVATAHGLAPSRSITSVGFAPSPPMYIGPPLTGIAADVPPRKVAGKWLSPQLLARDQERLFDPSVPARLKLGAVNRLQAAGTINPYGSETAPQVRQMARSNDRAYREQLLEQAWQVQKQAQANPSALGMTKREFMARAERFPTDVLERGINSFQEPENVVKMGIDPGSLSGLIEGTLSNMGDLGRAVTGDTLLGRAANDLLMWPTWAVPAAHSAITNPKAFAEGLTEGVIGRGVEALAGKRPWSDVKDAFSEHPLFSLAELRGGASVAGRAVAAPVRQATRGRVFGTYRDPINLTGLDMSSAYKDRSFSKDPITRAGQKLSDRVLTRSGLDVKDAQGRRVAASVMATERRGTGKLAEAARVHALNRLSDFNRAQGVTEQQVMRDATIETVRLSKINTALGRMVAKFVDLPSRPDTPEGYTGVLGRIAARAAEKTGVGRNVMLDPNAAIVGLVLRGAIRTLDENGQPMHVTARSVAADLDFRIKALKEELDANPSPYKSLPDREMVQATVAFLEGVRDSGRASNQAAQIARRLAPQFHKASDELVRLKALDPEAAERAPLFPPGISRLGLEYEGALGRNGETVPTGQIRQELREQGIDPALVAHLPHQQLGQGAFYKQDTQSRRNADSHALTGALWKRGESPFDWDHVEASLVNSQTLAANIRTLDRFVGDLGVRVADGSWKATVQAQRNSVVRNADGSIKKDAKGQPIYKFQAMRRAGSRIDPDRQEGIRQLQDVETDAPLTQALFDDRLKPPEQDGPDVAVLVPTPAVKRAQDHLKNGGTSIAAFQGLSAQFRATVLPFSVKWMFGNVAEAVLRTAMITVNPLERRTARIALDRMLAEDALMVFDTNPQVRRTAERMIKLGEGLATGRTRNWKEVRQLRQELWDHAPNARAAELELLGGLFFGARGQSVRRTAEEMGPVAGTVARAMRLPFINEYMAMTHWLGRKSFALNRMFEREAQYVVLGKHVRNELQAFSGRWTAGVKFQQQALEDFSRGMLGTPAQLKAANWLDETLGRYSRFSPTTRKWIQTYSPFLPWYLNAIRWTMVTVPFKHPIKFALWTNAERTFEQDWEEQHKDIPPGYGDFFASIKTKDDGYKLGLTQSTPFGLLGPVGGGGDLTDFAQLVLPQMQGALAPLKGQNPFGDPLEMPEDEVPGLLDFLKIAGYQFGESQIPLLNIIRRLREKGGTSLATSTFFDPQIKPGTEGNKGRGESAAHRVFAAPFRSTYLRAGTNPDAVVPPVPAEPETLQGRIAQRLRERNATSSEQSLQSRIAERLREQAIR